MGPPYGPGRARPARRAGLAGWPCLAGRWAAWLARLASWLARSGPRRKNAVPSQLACLAACPSACPSGWLAGCNKSGCLFVSLSVCPSGVSLILCPHVRLFVCLSACLPACLPIRPSVRPCVCLSACLLVAWSAWLALPGRRPARPRSGRHDNSAPPLLSPQVGCLVSEMDEMASAKAIHPKR